MHSAHGKDARILCSGVIYTSCSGIFTVLFMLLRNCLIVCTVKLCIHYAISCMIKMGKQIVFCWFPSHVDIPGNVKQTHQQNEDLTNQ